MNKHFLFLGAGFSRNFGLPLANDIWGKLFNSDLLKTYPEVEELIKQDHNFENIYYKILDNSSNQNKHLKKYFKELILNIFTEMDNRIISYLSYEKDRNVNLLQLGKFINRFSRNESEPGMIFSINQDLFIERFHINSGLKNYEKLVIPFLDSNWNFINKNISLLPFEQFTQNPFFSNNILTPLSLSKRYIGNKEHDNFLYIKLHGSFDWREKENEDVMIIGINKIDKIHSHTILSQNYELFKKTLTDKNNKIKLLIIGYSFNDQHINEVLESSKTELYVIDPQDPASFYNKMDETKVKQRIWRNNIKKYYCCTLEEIFPPNKIMSTYLIDLERCFFEV